MITDKRITIAAASTHFGITQGLIRKFILMGWIAKEKYGIHRQSQVLVRVQEISRVLRCLEIGSQPKVIRNSSVQINWSNKIKSIVYE